ncbi:MAG: immunity 8 family protein [Mycobacterium sp.]
MIAVLRDVHSPDSEDLRTFEPSASAFSILVQMLVGPASGDGEESFDVLVCSPDWLRTQPDPLVGRHLLIVHAFNWERIRSFLAAQVAACEGEDWSEVAQKVGRIGHWEFEDYRP